MSTTSSLNEYLLLSRGRWDAGKSPEEIQAAIADPDRAAAKRAFNAMMEMGKIDIARIEAARRG